MAKSMNAMAEMCRMMIQKEMAWRPFIMAAAALVSTLGTIALALFVALEVQWIRFWRIRIRQAKEGEKI